MSVFLQVGLQFVVNYMHFFQAVETFQHLKCKLKVLAVAELVCNVLIYHEVFFFVHQIVVQYEILIEC